MGRRTLCEHTAYLNAQIQDIIDQMNEFDRKDMKAFVGVQGAFFSLGR